MGPATTWVGSQSRLPPESRNGAEPSAAGWLAEPGQRLSMPVCRPARRCATGSGTSCAGPTGSSCELEGVEDRLDARVVAVGVVVGGADAEVAEPADELRDVRADELEHRLALLQRAGAVGEGRARDLLEARQLARRLDEVVVGARAGGRACERSAIVGLASRTQRAQLAQERREVLGRGLGVGDQRVEVVERRAQVHERRVAAPQRGRQQRQRLAERPVLGGDRARRGVRVADQRRRGRRGARRSPVTVREEETMKSRQRALVRGRLVDQPAGAGEQRVEVLGRLGGLLALAVELGLEAGRSRPAGPRGPSGSSVLKSWSRSTAVVVWACRVVAWSRQRPARVRPGRDRDVAVGDARQRRQPDDRLRALAQRRVGLLDADPDRRLVVRGQLDRRAPCRPRARRSGRCRPSPAGPRSRRSACTRARSPRSANR